RNAAPDRIGRPGHCRPVYSRECFVALDAMKLGGVDLRLDYGDPTGEAIACRSKCALFDFSFVKTVRLQGKHARRAVENFASRSLAELPEKKIAYALHVDTDGNALSDLTIWKIASDIFEVMSGRAEDVADLLGVTEGDLYATDLSADRAIFALQGPHSLAVLRRLGASASKNFAIFTSRRFMSGIFPALSAVSVIRARQDSKSSRHAPMRRVFGDCFPHRQ